MRDNAGWSQADTNLGKFLDYCTYGHMIDNVILIVTGTLHERDVQVCHPPSEHEYGSKLSLCCVKHRGYLFSRPCSLPSPVFR